MRLVTLGTGTISLTPGRACAGHHIEAGSVRMLLDCGSGVTHRMAEHGVDWQAITHVALTHFHTDHHGDWPSLVMAWKYGRLPGRTMPLVVVGPSGTAALLERLAAAHGEWLRDPGFAITVREIAPDERMDLGDDVTLAARKVPHTEESVAYSVERRGRRIVYSGDTGFDPAFGAWAQGCDLLLCECSLPVPMAIPSHLTPEQCAELAAVAQPGHVALTHLYPPVEAVDPAAIVAARYGGPVTVARDGWQIEIEEH